MNITQTVIIDDIGNFRFIPIFKALSSVIASTHNIDYKLYAQIAEKSKKQTERKLYQCIAELCYAAESYLYMADAVISCTESDAKYFENYNTRSYIVPNCMKMIKDNMVEEREMTTSSDTIKILFVGVLSYQPNITAARRLMNISRILKLKGVKHKIKILGKCNKAQRKLLQSEVKVTKNVEIIGPVEKLMNI